MNLTGVLSDEKKKRANACIGRKEITNIKN